MDIKTALKNSNIDSLDARLLLAHTLNKDSLFLMINPNYKLSKEEEDNFLKYVKRRKEGIATAYIIGKKDFYNSSFFVNENVLIPRPDSECLVEKALSFIDNKALKVLDLCTGSGCIGISLKKEVKDLDITLSDISEEALKVCRINYKRIIGEEGKILQSDLFENIKGNFDLIITNPPYLEPSFIKKAQKEVQNEPHLALSGISSDGLLIIDRIIKDAKKHLNGALIIESSDNQVEKIISLLYKEGYKEISFGRDLSAEKRWTYATYAKENY